VLKRVNAADVLILEDSEEAIRMMGMYLNKDNFMVSDIITGNV
jgi:hypothetical protein